MTTKHTPGPWRYQPGRDSRPPYVIRGSEGGFVVVGMTADRQEADAALIAAAPELLEALEKRAQADAAYAQLALSDVDPDPHERLLQQIEDAEDAAKDAARAAIAKAKGEQQ